MLTCIYLVLYDLYNVFKYILILKYKLFHSNKLLAMKTHTLQLEQLRDD